MIDLHRRIGRRHHHLILPNAPDEVNHLGTTAFLHLSLLLSLVMRVLLVMVVVSFATAPSRFGDD